MPNTSLVSFGVLKQQEIYTEYYLYEFEILFTINSEISFLLLITEIKIFILPNIITHVYDHSTQMAEAEGL
jgi:hypothetical protein